MPPPQNDPWTLQADGGSRGNPGPGAFGFVLADAGGREVEAHGEFLGTCTNNVAEYRGLIAGLEAAARHKPPMLLVCMDSELVIRQMSGQYKVKNETLRLLHAEAQRVASGLRQVTWSSVRRDHNTRADALVNEALDREMQQRRSESSR